MKHKIKGRYDSYCEILQYETKSDLAIVFVVNGSNGSGLSVTCRDKSLLEGIPELLRGLAKDIENQA